MVWQREESRGFPRKKDRETDDISSLVLPLLLALRAEASRLALQGG